MDHKNDFFFKIFTIQNGSNFRQSRFQKKNLREPDFSDFFPKICEKLSKFCNIFIKFVKKIKNFVKKNMKYLENK